MILPRQKNEKAARLANVSGYEVGTDKQYSISELVTEVFLQAPPKDGSYSGYVSVDSTDNGGVTYTYTTSE